MPDLDGFQLASMIRDHPRFQTTAIIFVSAIQVTDLDLLRGYALGAVDYVPVPVVPELLRAKVKVFAELYRKTRQLESLNAELENRVAERTAELGRANAELEERVEERTREREAALAQVHEMQKLESLGQLTGGVAHDFNNLLMAILGNLELVRKRVAADERALRLIDGAIQGAERGASLTKRMLAFARRQELKPEAVDIGKLVDSMIEMLRRSVGPTIEITTEFEPDLAPTRVDPNQLELALLNLAVNARDAMPAWRASRASPPALTGSLPGRYRGSRRATMSLSGSPTPASGWMRRPYGAPPSRFSRPRTGAAALGSACRWWMASSASPVAPCGSAASPVSAPRSSCGCRLQRPKRWIVRTQARPSNAGETRALRVLVVDDDAIVRASTVAMIEDLGHAALEAASAADALELLGAERQVDAVITDYAMPGVTGTALAAQIGRIRPGLPVVIATGYADMPPQASALPRLDKPYRQKELAALLETLRERRFPSNIIATASGRYRAAGVSGR